MEVPNALKSFRAAALVACTACLPLAAQSGYDKPPQYILDVMHAPSLSVPEVSPTHDTVLLVSWQDYPPISRVATPFLRLAGARAEPPNPSRHDPPAGYGITPCATKFDLVRVADG